MQQAQEKKGKPCVYLSNVPYEVGSLTILDLFHDEDIEPIGVEILMAGGPGRKKSCGLATVYLHSEADVAKACSEIDGKTILDRPVIVRKDKFVNGDMSYTHDMAALDQPARKPGAKPAGKSVTVA